MAIDYERLLLAQLNVSYLEQSLAARKCQTNNETANHELISFVFTQLPCLRRFNASRLNTLNIQGNGMAWYPTRSYHIYKIDLITVLTPCRSSISCWLCNSLQTRSACPGRTSAPLKRSCPLKMQQALHVPEE